MVRPKDAAKATVAVATTAMISRVLSEDRRSKRLFLDASLPSLDDGDSAHGGENGLCFCGLHITDEALRVGRDCGILVHERERDSARIAAIGRVVPVDLEHAELHLECLGERTETDRPRHLFYGV